MLYTYVVLCISIPTVSIVTKLMEKRWSCVRKVDLELYCACTLGCKILAHLRCSQQCLGGRCFISCGLRIDNDRKCWAENLHQILPKTWQYMLRPMQSFEKGFIALNTIKEILYNWHPSVFLVNWKRFRQKLNRHAIFLFYNLGASPEILWEGVSRLERSKVRIRYLIYWSRNSERQSRHLNSELEFRMLKQMKFR